MKSVRFSRRPDGSQSLEGRRVVLFAPKAAREGVWEPHLREWLPHIGGVGGGGDFSNLAVFNHTDLGRGGDFPERFRRIAELADAVVIDEAHHFRNPGRRGDPERGIPPSRYHRMFDLLDDAERPKSLFMLTATPINNRLSDFRHMAELFTRRDDRYFARTVGVNHLKAHFNRMEKALRDRAGSGGAGAAEHLEDAQDLLGTDAIFRELVVQRSRAYARESQIREHGEAAAFPERKAPQVASYSVRKTYGGMLDLFEKAFAKKDPLFTLPMYYPLHWYTGPDTDIDPLEEGRQKQVVGLIRTNFLKRFESSVAAFELSCDRLLKKLLAFLEVHGESDAEKRRLTRWKAQNSEVLGYAAQRHLALWGDEEEEDDGEDVVPEEMLAAVEVLDRDDYDVVEMMSETFLDLDQIAQFLNEARRFEPKHDDKLQKLVRLLRSKALAGEKVLVFTEFADTARYLWRELEAAGLDGLEQLDGSTRKNRAEVIRRFAPYYNAARSRTGAGRQGRDPHPDLDRRAVRGAQSSGRVADDQLRHPLEPGAPHAADRARGPAHEPGDREENPGGTARSSRFARDGPVLELPAAEGAQQAADALQPGHPEDAADLADAGHRGAQAVDARRRLRGAQGVQPRLRGHPHIGGGVAFGVSGAAQGRPGAGSATVEFPRPDLQRPEATGKGRARRLLLLRAARAGQGEGRVHRRGRNHPVVLLRHER